MADDYKAPSRVISTNIGEVGDDPSQLKYLECLVLVVRRMAQLQGTRGQSLPSCPETQSQAADSFNQSFVCDQHYVLCYTISTPHLHTHKQLLGFCHLIGFSHEMGAKN